MNLPDLCPACLTVLPADYPYDHVEIDQALTIRPRLFTTMSNAQRTETILAGLARGRSLNQLVAHFRWQYAHIRALLPADHPLWLPDQRADLEQQIAALWAADLSDSQIALRIGQTPNRVQKIRKYKLRLPSRFGPRGRRKAGVA